MEPLRKLRQDCTVPMVFNRSEVLSTKKVLNPKELLQHMTSNTENDCKTELRTIVSSLNGNIFYLFKETLKFCNFFFNFRNRSYSNYS